MVDRDLPLKNEIAKNIRRLMKLNGFKSQLRLSKVSGISKSTLSDYLNSRTLINPGNVEKLSAVFNVDKSEIDPSFGTSKDMSKKEKQIKTIAAHIDDDVTDEEMEDIMKYIEYLKSRRN